MGGEPSNLERTSSSFGRRSSIERSGSLPPPFPLETAHKPLERTLSPPMKQLGSDWDSQDHITSTYRAFYGGPAGVDATSWTVSSPTDADRTRSQQRGSLNLFIEDDPSSPRVLPLPNLSKRRSPQKSDITSKITEYNPRRASSPAYGFTSPGGSLPPPPINLAGGRQSSDASRHSQHSPLAAAAMANAAAAAAAGGGSVFSMGSAGSTPFSGGVPLDAASMSVATVTITSDGDTSSAGVGSAQFYNGPILTLEQAAALALGPQTPAVEPPMSAASGEYLVKSPAGTASSGGAASMLLGIDDDVRSTAGSSASPALLDPSWGVAAAEAAPMLTSKLQRVDDAEAVTMGLTRPNLAPEQPPTGESLHVQDQNLQQQKSSVVLGGSDGESSALLASAAAAAMSAGGGRDVWAKLEASINSAQDGAATSAFENTAASYIPFGFDSTAGGMADRSTNQGEDDERIEADFARLGIDKEDSGMLMTEADAAAHEAAALLSIVATGNLEEQKHAGKRLLHSIREHQDPVRRATHAAGGIAILQTLLGHKDEDLRTLSMALMAEICVLKEAQQELASAPTAAAKVVGLACQAVAGGHGAGARLLTALTKGQGEAKNFFLAACAHHKAMRILIDAATNAEFTSQTRDNALEALEGICAADPASGYKKLGWGGGLAQFVALMDDKDRWPVVTRLLTAALKQDKTLAELLAEPHLVSTLSQYVANPDHEIQLQSAASSMLAAISDISLRKEETTQALIDWALPRACEILHDVPETPNSAKYAAGGSNGWHTAAHLTTSQGSRNSYSGMSNGSGGYGGASLSNGGVGDLQQQLQESSARLVGNLACDSSVCCHVIIFHTVVLKTVVSVLIRNKHFLLAQQVLRASANYAANADMVM